MNRLSPYWTAVLALTTTLTGLSPRNVHAGCCDHVTAIEEDNQSALILEARVTGRTCLKLKNGTIVTNVTIQPIETFKGVNQSEPLVIRMSGGQVGNEGQYDSGFIRLITGQDYIFRLTCYKNTWKCLHARVERAGKASEKRRNSYRAIRKQQGKKSQRLTLTSDSLASADGTDNTAELLVKPPNPDPIPEVPASGYTEDDSGIPSRFAICDSGEPIHYLVDTDILPAGINQSQALQAVEDALAVWSNASGLIFKYDGNVSFGRAASAIQINDYKLRIQLHNKYNLFDNNSSKLGEGGGRWTFPLDIDDQPIVPDGGAGGRVNTQEFHLRTRAYLSLNHVSSTMQNLSTFTEVLTHELGHALGLDHSSENSGEANSNLKEAMMYYRVHADGRGASLGSYDHQKIDFGYPASNMPPTGMNRIIHAVMSNTPINDPNVNSVTIIGHDRETPNNLSLNALMNTASSNYGTFTVDANSSIKYNPTAYISGSPVTTETGSYDDVYYRTTDGTNLSALCRLRIVSLNPDSTPSDGLPDSWMTTHFGITSVGVIGDDHHPDSDPDGDGLSNRIEFIYGTDPNDAADYAPLMSYDHAAQTVSWNTVNRMPYYLEYSDNINTWTNIGAFLGNGARLTSDVINSSNTQRFYRIKLQP